MIKLHLGCGRDYKEGWINVDFNKDVKADIYCDISKKLPFKNNYVDEVLMDNVLEHVKRDRLLLFIDDLYRVCKNGAKIRIYVPHFTATAAFKHLTHYNFFGVTSFGIMEAKNKSGINVSGERYNKSKFNILQERLMILSRISDNFGFLNKFASIFDWFFNLGGLRWKLFWEKFNIFGFEEIYYKLEFVK